MFGRKKRKNSLFGANVEQSCEVCAHSAMADGVCRCLLGTAPGKKGLCKKYAYDPLKREPRRAPPLTDFDPEVFKL